jgi:hypothetical protein
MGGPSLEIVSHCWQYAHLLAYQLSSIALHPPLHGSVRVTVFYSPEDHDTTALLQRIGRMSVDRVEWNWQPLERPRLMRRAIGRDLAARATQARWVWFTDCDVVFDRGCLDAAIELLAGCTEPLVFPREEWRTSLLPENHPLLRAGATAAGLVEIDRSEFSRHPVTEAKGPFQIARGDIARAYGYCQALKVFHEPSDTWRKCHEDRAFRWLLGTRGVPLEIPAVYRIRHQEKGRYSGSRSIGRLRRMIRRFASHLAELRRVEIG